jgi:hypothetical protein
MRFANYRADSSCRGAAGRCPGHISQIAVFVSMLRDQGDPCRGILAGGSLQGDPWWNVLLLHQSGTMQDEHVGDRRQLRDEPLLSACHAPAASAALRRAPKTGGRRHPARPIALNPAGGAGGVRCGADYANITSELGQDAGGPRKRNSGAAEAAVRHQKIVV